MTVRKKRPASKRIHPTNFVCTIDKFLIEQDITRTEMSRQTGLDQGYLSRVANNKIVPYVTSALLIAKWLGVSVEELWVSVKKEK